MDLTEFKILSVKQHHEPSRKKMTSHENTCNIYISDQGNIFTRSTPAEKQVKDTKYNLQTKEYKWPLNLRKAKTNLNSDQINERWDKF